MDNTTLTANNLLSQLSQTKGASDLLITVGKPPQLRIYNEIGPLDFPELTKDDTERLCMSVLNKEQAEKLEKNKEVDLSLVVEDVGRFRINVYKQRGCLALVARVILEQVPGFKELNLPAIMARFAMLPRGLVIITGPIGCGKSTSVAAMVDYINKHRCCHIVSIEDPIEYVHTHDLATIDQREVGEDTHSFAAALRSVLRQSTDIVVLGEIRDRESAQAAITLAETGHLTITTLHTRGVVATISRLVDMFPSEQSHHIRVQIAASLAGVIWQQLLPRKEAEGGGGLIPSCEIMAVTPAVRSLVRHGRLHELPSVLQAGKKYGMCTMEQSLEALLKDGLIDNEWLKQRHADFSVAKA